MKMPFGKHKGTELNQIPVSYLRWVLEDASDSAKTPDLILAIRKQLESVRPQPFDDSVADEPLAEEDEPVLEDIPPDEAYKGASYLLAELQKARAELKRAETQHAALQDRMNQFVEYFDKWYRVVSPVLHLERNHAAEIYFNQLKKEVEKWKDG